MASWLAAGPPGMTWAAFSRVVASVKPLVFWTTPWLTRTMAATKAMGSRTLVMPRMRSTQKFPMVSEWRRTRPRMRATATARPTAAEAKFCTARPTIWVRWLMVLSPA